MADDDRSLFDRAKDALGMGDKRNDPDELPATEAVEPPAGASVLQTDVTVDAKDRPMEQMDDNRVRTEYEMGYEFDPEHEKVAESGLFAERAGTAEVDTWSSANRVGDEEPDSKP